MRDVGLALLLVEVLELLARELGVAGEVVVASVGDPLQLRPAHREQVLDVGGRRRVVGELVRPVLAQSQVVGPDAEVGVPAHPVAPSTAGARSSASSGGTKYSISIISNSRVRKMKLPGVISLRNALPIWAIPNGGFLRANWSTFLKLTKIPWAVSGRRIDLRRVLADRAHEGLEHQVELARLGEVALGVLAGMHGGLSPAFGVLELVRPEAKLAGAAIDHRVGEALQVARGLPGAGCMRIAASRATMSSRSCTTARHHSALTLFLSRTP